MDRRDFLKTVAITGAALSIQHSEAMEILTQTINNTNGGNPDLVAVMGGEPEAIYGFRDDLYFLLKVKAAFHRLPR